MTTPDVNEFAAYVAGFCAKATVGAYRLAARRFIAENPVIEADSLVRYVGSCGAKGASPATIAVHVAGLKHLIEFARQRGIKVPDHMAPLNLPRVRSPVAGTMTRAELLEFDDLCCSVPEPISTLMRILPLSGMRISEAAGLKVSDLTPPSDGGMYLISVRPNEARTIKGKSDRQVVVIGDGTEILNHYCQNTYPNLKGFRGSSSVWLFPSDRGKPVPRRTVAGRFTEVGTKMGRPDLSCHASRHAHCTLLEDAGLSLFEILAQMGHASATTAQRYVHSNIERRRRLMAAIRVDGNT